MRIAAPPAALIPTGVIDAPGSPWVNDKQAHAGLRACLYTHRLPGFASALYSNPFLKMSTGTTRGDTSRE